MALGRDACLVSGAISIMLIRSCLIESSATTEKNPSRGHRQEVMNSIAKTLTQEHAALSSRALALETGNKKRE